MTVLNLPCAGEKRTLAINDKFDDEIQGLIDAGKEKGYLTYGDVNDMMPEEISSADDMDDLLTTIGSQGIDLLDAPKFPGDKDFEIRHLSNSPQMRLEQLRRSRGTCPHWPC